MDVAIQKSTELGVTAIQPIEMERSIVRLSAQRAERPHASLAGGGGLACEHAVATACPRCGR
jgi:16S rRNA (uracil1498-N3)-methyltransferase